MILQNTEVYEGQIGMGACNGEIVVDFRLLSGYVEGDEIDRGL